MTRRRFHWECFNCASEIFPKIKVRASRSCSRKLEKTPLFHAVELRNLVEAFLRVDENYSRVRHRKLESLRLNKRLYWNLIYYFSKLGLPLQFLIPYVPKDLLKDSASQIEVLNHATLLDKVRIEGIGYLESWIEAKQRKEKKREEKKLAQAKATG